MSGWGDGRWGVDKRSSLEDLFKLDLPYNKHLQAIEIVPYTEEFVIWRSNSMGQEQVNRVFFIQNILIGRSTVI